MQARYYDPVIGRFYGNDPVDSVSHLSRTGGIHGFNRYAYANNNPYKYTDPDGRETRLMVEAHHLDMDVANGNMTSQERLDISKAQFDGMLASAPGGAIVKGASVLKAGLAARHLSKVLTPAQQARMKTIKNILHRNAKDHDFEGVAKELKGIDTGFDHITEMKQSVTGLTKAIKGLQGSLKNPNLDDAARKAIQNSLDSGQKTLDRMNKALGGG